MRVRRVTRCDGLNRTRPRSGPSSTALRAYLGLGGVVLVLMMSAWAVSAQTAEDLAKREVKDALEEPSEAADKQTVDEALDPQESSGNGNGTSLRHKIDSFKDSSGDPNGDPGGSEDPDVEGDPDDPTGGDDPRDGERSEADRGQGETDPVEDWDPVEKCPVAVFQACGQQPPEARGGPGGSTGESGQSTQSSGAGGPPGSGDDPSARTLDEETTGVKETSTTSQTALQAASGSGLAILVAWTLFVASAGSYDRSKTRLEKREETVDPSVTGQRMQVPRQGARAVTRHAQDDPENRSSNGKPRKGRV